MSIIGGHWHYALFARQFIQYDGLLHPVFTDTPRVERGILGEVVSNMAKLGSSALGETRP